MNFVHEFTNIFALYSLSYHFLENFLACCAHSIAFYPHLEMKACNVLYQLHL